MTAQLFKEPFYGPLGTLHTGLKPYVATVVMNLTFTWEMFSKSNLFLSIRYKKVLAKF